jgi:hypothetical protein
MIEVLCDLFKYYKQKLITQTIINMRDNVMKRNSFRRKSEVITNQLIRNIKKQEIFCFRNGSRVSESAESSD